MKINSENPVSFITNFKTVIQEETCENLQQSKQHKIKSVKLIGSNLLKNFCCFYLCNAIRVPPARILSFFSAIKLEAYGSKSFITLKSF